MATLATLDGADPEAKPERVGGDQPDPGDQRDRRHLQHRFEIDRGNRNQDSGAGPSSMRLLAFKNERAVRGRE